MKNGTIVIFFLTQSQKVFASLWSKITMKFQIYISKICMDSHIALLSENFQCKVSTFSVTRFGTNRASIFTSFEVKEVLVKLAEEAPKYWNYHIQSKWILKYLSCTFFLLSCFFILFLSFCRLEKD